MLTLADAQQCMADALFDSRCESTALAMFRGDPIAVQQRLAIYRGNLAATWNKTLAGAYPVLQVLVGEEFFAALSRAFGKQHPSNHGDLNLYGAQFADFLATFPHVADYPYFPDVARVEWAVHRAHAASAPPAFDWRTLAALTPQQLDETRWHFHPACSLLSSEWAVAQIWHAHQADSQTALPAHLATAEFAITVRPQWKVDLLCLNRADFLALHYLQRGAPLGEALDVALLADPQFDFSTRLQQWLAQSVLVAFA